MSETKYIDCKYQYGGSFDDGVELAYILNRSMDLELTRGTPSVKKAEAIQHDVYAILLGHQSYQPFLENFRQLVTPEPYKSIFDASISVSNAARNLYRRNIWAEQAKAVNQEFQSRLIDVIGEFCAIRNEVSKNEVSTS